MTDEWEDAEDPDQLAKLYVALCIGLIVADFVSHPEGTVSLLEAVSGKGMDERQPEPQKLGVLRRGWRRWRRPRP